MPVIVRDIPVYNGWLVNNVNCLKASSDAEFEKLLGDLILNQDLRSKLSIGALALAKEESIETQGEILRKTYEKLMQS